jgi:subtilisin family serine protease
MTPQRPISWVAVAAAAALALPSSAPAARPTDLCDLLDLVVPLHCDGKPPPPSSSSSSGTGAQSSAQETPDQDQPVPVPLSPTTPRHDPQRIAVMFERGTPRQTVEAVAARAGTTVEEAIPKLGAYMLHVDPSHRDEALGSLRSSDAVASASQELLKHALDTNPDDVDWPQQTGLRIVGFPKAWDLTRGSSRVVVAVLDTGVDAKQPDLRGALVPGYDFVHSNTSPVDDHGHGTAVAGVIAARANNHEGVAGICWRCSVMPVKILNAQGSGDDTVIAAGIVWAVDHGAQVINLSLGGPGTSDALTAAIGYAVAKGVIVVAAAGNSGTTTPFYPAADPRAISVAATTVADHRYSWSNFGAWVNVAAPGCNVAPLLAGGYGWFCGTSSATPVVAGLIALERSFAPLATPEQVVAALVRAVHPLPDVVHYGRIDAGQTLALLTPTENATVVFRGTAGPHARTYRVDADTGTIDATLRFVRTKLTLSLTSVDAHKPLARVSGTSPLRLHASVNAGTFVLRVASAKKTSFVLEVSYAKAARR